MNERIKQLRLELGLTLERFGARLGVSKAAISRIENGISSVTDHMINTICRTSWDGKFVSEKWLRTGEGSMFVDLDVQERIAKFVAKVPNEPDDSFKIKLLSVMANLTEEQWETLADIAEQFASENENTDVDQ